MSTVMETTCLLLDGTTLNYIILGFWIGFCSWRVNNDQNIVFRWLGFKCFQILQKRRFLTGLKFVDSLPFETLHLSHIFEIFFCNCKDLKTNIF